jgi:signal transduction histidine kinase
MTKLYVILTLTFFFHTKIVAQNLGNNISDFGMISMDERWEFTTENKVAFSYEKVLKIESWQTIEHFPSIFPSNAKAVWLKKTIHNPTSSAQSVRIITKGIDSLNAFWSSSSISKNTYITGKNILLYDRFVASQYLVVPLDLPARSHTQVFIRLYNQGYSLSLPYLKILSPATSAKFIKTGEMGYNIYLGGVLLMILFSLILFIFFKERLYFFYFLCLMGSFIMAFVYNDFYYLFFQKAPEFVRSKNIFAVLLTLLNILYLLFAERYLNVDIRKNSQIIKGSRIVMATLLLLLIGLLSFQNQELYYYRMLFYPLFGANTSVMYYHLLVSIQKKYSPSWYFLIATTPIAIVSVMEITSDFNGIPVQTMHDFYYTSTFIEIFFLTIGIVYRFRLERTKAQLLEQRLFVSEIETQDRERERIAKDLHDNIGSSIVGIQLQLNAFIETFFSIQPPPPDLQKVGISLEKAYKEVQNISHDLTPQILSNLGLVEQIKEKYQFVSKPIFKLSLPSEPLNLNQFTEYTLYKIINEAVSNILKYAKATEVGISLEVDKKTLKLRIEDNGIGFDLYQNKKGMGLGNLKLRTESQLKGMLNIESSPGNGTIISVKIPFKNRSSTRDWASLKKYFKILFSHQ